MDIPHDGGVVVWQTTLDELGYLMSHNQVVAGAYDPPSQILRKQRKPPCVVVPALMKHECVKRLKEQPIPSWNIFGGKPFKVAYLQVSQERQWLSDPPPSCS